MNSKTSKKIIRRELLAIRDGIPATIRAEKDSLIEAAILSLPEFVQAKTILFYASFRSEVDTLGLMREPLEMDKRVVLPRVDGERHELLLYEISDPVGLEKGYMGIPEPRAAVDKAVSIDDIDLAVLPGAAFDISGNRLGYGAGYYDALLTSRRKKMPVLALSYDEQIVHTIPSEGHDVKMDIIVTNKRVIRCQ